MNRYKKFTALKLCNGCSLQLSESQTSEHLAVLHPEIKKVILKIYKKLKSVPKVNQKFPAMDCSNLCATKLLANYLIVNIVKNEPSCLVLVKQLSEKLSSLSDFNFISNKRKQCHLCSLSLLSASEAIGHFMLRHPEYLALVLFLQFRPLSDLNFYVHEIPDNQATSEKLFQRIDGTRVLGVRQPIVRIKKLPDHLYEECIAKGFVNLKEKNKSQSLFDPQPNPRLNKISTKVIQKMKETATKPSQSNAKNSVVVLAPGILLNSCQESSDSEVSSQSNESQSLFDPQPNPRLNKISGKVIQKMKETATKPYQSNSKNSAVVIAPEIMLNTCQENSDSKVSSQSNENNSVVLAPGNMLNSQQENSDSEGCITSHSLRNTTSSKTTSKAICYRVEDVKIDHLRGQSVKDKIMKKQKFLKKLLNKHHEKEARKEVVYWQRGLTVYVKRNQRYLRELEEQLLNARKLLKNIGGYEKLLAQVNSDLDCRVGKTVKFYLKKIFKAIENVQALVSKWDGYEQIEQPLFQNHQKFPAPKDGCDKKFNSSTTDLLVNNTLVTEDKQLVECYYCEKLNCEGLHPENFIH